MAQDPRIKGVLFASLTSIFWGFLAIALKVASGIMDPVTIVWFRFVVAFSFLALYYSFANPSYLKILIKPPMYLVIASIGLGINYLAFLYGVQLTTAGTAQVIIQIGPISLGFIGFIFFKEKISIRQSIGFLVAGTGLFIFYRDSLSNISGDENLFNMGILWVVVAAMSWVAYASLQKTLVKTYPPQQLNLFLFGLPILLFLPFIKPSGFLDLSLTNWLLLIYLGLNTLIAYGSLAMAFKYLEANKISIIVTMNPIITFMIMGLLAFMEVTWITPEILTFKGMLAAFLVIIGAIMAVAFSKKNTKKEITEIFKKK
jgi:drug/metabolite transporter (DMT)-like permease